MKASEVLSAVAAGMSTASALDLSVDDAVVLHDSNRLAVMLYEPILPELLALDALAANASAPASQEALANASGLHSIEISQLERGVRDPRLPTICRVAQALHTTAAVLTADCC